MTTRRNGLRVALVSEHASPLAVLGGVDAGGQNVHVNALARALAELGCEVDVYTRRDDVMVPDRVTMAAGVTVVHVDAGPPEPIAKDELLPYMGAFGDELERLWGVRRPDVVHAHFWMSGLAAFEACQALDLPIVQTFHALGVVKRRQQGVKDTSPGERIGVESLLVREVDHVLATCSDEVFELLRMGGDSHRISVVPCGVDLTTFTPAGPIEPRRAGGPPNRIVVVSRLVERKGIGNVITALADIPDAELVVAGGPDRARLCDDAEARRLMDLARATGVADRVDFRGRVERGDVPALLRSADVVVCVPWYEPFGIVPLEAMACGRPVVASAVGGLVDTVVDEVTGLHVPPRDPARVAGAVRTLLDRPDLRASFGAAGAARATARYDWRRVAAGTLAVYGSLVDARRSVDAERRGS
jgi:glycosyltransferase involved in cell wall biosynthesis